MIQIRKSSEPAKLVEHKSTPGTDFNGLDKPPIREALLKEQGYLCAYCTKRIEMETSSIEHFFPQSLYPDLSLTYSNLLAVCNNTVQLDQPHCDIAKGDNLIKYNPSDLSVNVEALVEYGSNGEISGTNDLMTNQIETLKLRLDPMNKFRASALNEARARVKLLGQNRRAYTEVLSEYTQPFNGKLRPYAGIVRYFLKRKIDKWNS